ncbi:hypothetical protein KFE98_02960 [bacterium SCSIO 12741]|nr:hypothetical protein KFE98_02960 [bacterium SCSIO 12741]
MKIKRILGSAVLIGIVSSASAQMTGTGVQYNNTPGAFSLPSNGVGVLRLTHEGETPGGVSSLPAPLYHSTHNAILDWKPTVNQPYRYSQIAFRDPDLISTDKIQSSLISYGSFYTGTNHASNDIGFKSHMGSVGGHHFFLDGFRLGINTYDPKGSIHVNLEGNGSSQALVIDVDVSNPNVNAHYADIVFQNPDMQTHNPGAATNRDWIIRSISTEHQSYGQTLEFWAPEFQEPRVYFPNGKGPIKVGIGVAPGSANYQMTGGYQLYVATGILTERLKVATLGTTEWADYVFDEEYDLRDLKEVEAFVQENHHLPDVPSAAEVEENGVDMVDMDATLLRKIEELTLYVIQLSKENEEMKQQLDALK